MIPLKTAPVVEWETEHAFPTQRSPRNQYYLPAIPEFTVSTSRRSKRNKVGSIGRKQEMPINALKKLVRAQNA
jgi:hypothetical protein